MRHPADLTRYTGGDAFALADDFVGRLIGWSVGHSLGRSVVGFGWSVGRSVVGFGWLVASISSTQSFTNPILQCKALACPASTPSRSLAAALCGHGQGQSGGLDSELLGSGSWGDAALGMG